MYSHWFIECFQTFQGSLYLKPQLLTIFHKDNKIYQIDFLPLETWTKISNFCSLTHHLTVHFDHERKLKRKICFKTSIVKNCLQLIQPFALHKNHQYCQFRPGHAIAYGRRRKIYFGRNPKKKMRIERFLLVAVSIGNHTARGRRSLIFLTQILWGSWKRLLSWLSKNKRSKHFLFTPVWSK